LWRAFQPQLPSSRTHNLPPPSLPPPLTLFFQREAPRGGPSGSPAAGESGDAAVSRMLASLSSGPGARFDLRSYAKFTSLVRGGGAGVVPKLRPVTWLMRMVEDLYEARYAKDIESLRRAGPEGDGGGEDASPPFPDFVAGFLERKYGVGGVAAQHCWDLLYTAHTLRREVLAVETFARFMEESYDADDLLFYLYARSTVQKELGVSLGKHWVEGGRGGGEGGGGGSGAAPPPLTITGRQCAAVSRIVFGSEAHPHYKSFAVLLEAHLGGSRDSFRAVDVPTFLHLALVKYHETRGGGGGGGGGGGAGGGSGGGGAGGGGAGGGGAAESEADRLFREAMNAYDDRTRGLGGSARGASAEAGGGRSRSSGGVGGGGGGAPPRVSTALMNALTAAVGAAMDRTLDAILAAEGAGLSDEFSDIVREELNASMEKKVDDLLQKVIDGDAHGEPAVGALAHRFRNLVAADAAGEADPAAVDTFCEELTSCSAVVVPIQATAKTLCSHARTS
jgi:hypothetical protein